MQNSVMPMYLSVILFVGLIVINASKVFSQNDVNEEHRVIMNKWKKQTLENLQERHIEPDEAVDLIQQYKGKKINDFDYYFLKYSGTKGLAVYELVDGRCILIDEQWGAFAEKWESRESLKQEVVKKQKEMDGEVPPLHPLQTIPLGMAFIDKVPSLIKSLPIVMGIDSTLMDGSIESLYVIDSILTNLDVTYDSLVYLYPHIVAYCGLVFIKQTGGIWHIRDMKVTPIGITEENITVTDSSTYTEFSGKFDEYGRRYVYNESQNEIFWEPYILLSTGETLNPWSPVYTALFDIQEENATIQSGVLRELRAQSLK